MSLSQMALLLGDNSFFVLNIIQAICFLYVIILHLQGPSIVMILDQELMRWYTGPYRDQGAIDLSVVSNPEGSRTNLCTSPMYTRFLLFKIACTSYRKLSNSKATSLTIVWQAYIRTLLRTNENDEVCQRSWILKNSKWQKKKIYRCDVLSLDFIYFFSAAT